jgi:hypothetical protein
MNPFRIEMPTSFQSCPACVEYYAHIHSVNGVIGCALHWVVTSLQRHVSPFQAIDEYMAAVHASGHADNAPPLDVEWRYDALHDERPARLRVTRRMVLEQRAARKAPQRFLPLPKFPRLKGHE